MPDVRRFLDVAQRAPLRIPLVFPTVSGTYQFNVNAARTDDDARITGDGQFILGSLGRAAGVITGANMAQSWLEFVPGRSGVGTPTGLLRNQNPPTTQIFVALTRVDSEGREADYVSGRYRLTRLDATTYAPDSPTAARLDMAIISVETAPGIFADVEGVQILLMGSYENLEGPDPAHAGAFALQVTPLATPGTRYAGTLYASRQDADSVQSLIQAAGQLAYSAERLYLTRYEGTVQVGQIFRAEGRLFTLSELRRVARRYMLLAADGAG